MLENIFAHQMITNQETSTRIDEVAAGIYRICTPLDVIPGGFTFNSYLLTADEPLAVPYRLP